MSTPSPKEKTNCCLSQKNEVVAPCSTCLPLLQTVVMVLSPAEIFSAPLHHQHRVSLVVDWYQSRDTTQSRFISVIPAYFPLQSQFRPACNLNSFTQLSEVALQKKHEYYDNSRNMEAAYKLFCPHVPENLGLERAMGVYPVSVYS